VGGGLLFFGSRMGSSRSGWITVAKLASALAVLIATDYYLTVYAFGYAFHTTAYLVTWLWYAAACLLGLGILRKPTALKVIAGALASATSFFLLSNTAVWAGGTMYPRSIGGLGACLTAGLPFYRNDLASTLLTAGALFGLPVLAAKIAESVQAAQHNNLPMA
jgi:hypothetical protein